MGISAKIRQNLTSGSLIRRVADEGARMRGDGQGEILDLSLGNPTLEPPAAFREALRSAIDAPDGGHHRYMNNNGYPEVREAMAADLTKHYRLPFTPDLICMSVGAAGGINTVLKTLLDPGDEVIIFSPYFVEYGFYIDNHNGKTVIVPTDDEFQIDPAAVEAALTPRTKMIMINTPNNPTGVVYSEEKLAALAAVLEAHEKKTGKVVYILNDSPYRRLVYQQPLAPEPFACYPHSILASSFSKDLGIPGERLGFVAFSPQCAEVSMMAEAMAFSSRVLGFVNAPALMQRALPRLLNEMIDISIYKRKRDRLVEGLRGAGYEMVVPEGAFYLYPKAPGGDDLALYEKLKAERLLVVPGSGFGTPGFFRIAYCTHDEVIERALPIFASVAATL